MVVPDSDMQMLTDKRHTLRADAMCEPVRERVLKGEHPNRMRSSALALVSRLGPHRRLPDHPPDGKRPRILIIRPDHLGDVLFTSPAVQRIRAACPQAAITYMSGPWSSDAAQRLPGVSRVWPYPFPGFSRTTWTTLHLAHEREAAKVLHIPTNVTQVALIPVAYFKGADLRSANRLPARTVTHWNTWDTKP